MTMRHYVTANRRDANEKWVFTCASEQEAALVKENLESSGLCKYIRTRYD